MTQLHRQENAEPASLGSARPDPNRLMVWLIILLVVVFLAPIVWLPFTSNRRAAARADEYRSALVLLDTEADEVRDTLRELTDPTADPSSFAGLLTTIGDLRDGARAAGSVAAEPVPFAWPLSSSAPFERLVPIRERLEDHAVDSEMIVSTLVDVLNHRAVFADVLAVGEIPVEAPSRFARFRADMASAAESQAALVDSLPRNALLADHEAAIRSAVRRFENWVEEYVGALFEGRAADIEMLLRELTNLRVGLDLGMAATLASVRQDLNDRIDRLVEAVDASLVLLDG